MDEEKLKRAAGLLKEASDMLFSVENNSNASSRRTNEGSIAETLVRARSMMQTSSNSGLYRRLNRNERLRAAATSTTKNKKEKKSKNLEKKPFEFALLRANSEESDEEDDVETLKKEKIVERGMVVLNEDDSESSVRAKIVSSLKTQYSMLGPNDFDFIKVTQKKISVLRLAENTEYNYGVVKKLAGQGLLYIRMKQAFDFVLNEPDSEQDQFYTLADEEFTESHQPDQRSTSATTRPPRTFTSTTSPQTEEFTTATQHQREEVSIATTHQTSEEFSFTTKPHTEDTGEAFYGKIVSDFPSASIAEPTEMLRYLQSKIVRGRSLDVTDDATILVGATNCIAVDRDNILETTFDELRSVEDPRITFQVEFYGELAQDSGGPRKEWIRLCNQQIKTKYFDCGLKEHLAEDYYYVGQMAAIALLQNGQAPKYFPEDILKDIFVSEESVMSPCILKLREGLDSLGIHMFARKYPQFLYLFRPQENARLTVPLILHLLKPKFSDEGSNSLMHEKAVYGKFVKYLREVAIGRRMTSLENVLQFVTGASEEPILGFSQHPSIHFMVAIVSEVKVDKEDSHTDGQVNIQLLDTQRLRQEYIDLTLNFKSA